TTRNTRTRSTRAGSVGVIRALRTQQPSRAMQECASWRCSTTIPCARTTSSKSSTTRSPRPSGAIRSHPSSRARAWSSTLAQPRDRRTIPEMTTTTDSDRSDSAAELVSFVPRLTIDWLRSSPELAWLEVDGTLAFVDISGFTAMSEQLSSQGRAGAEEVTDVMNKTFSALLEEAYGLGGGLLKFGGDALLLLYEGERHAARAARAAFEMRRTLRAIGRPRTSAGTVQLKMHAGLHSGTFHFFLVGDPHRELLVPGPAPPHTVH